MMKVVIAGRPNTGKSTLFNALTGTRDALVHDRPGVTRDIISGTFSNRPYTLYDTAGLENAKSGIGLDSTNMLKINLKKKLSAVYNSTGIINYIQKAEVPEHIETLGEAIRKKRKVILKAYESSHSQEISDRFIEPFEFTTNCIDIWGYDIEKQENRVFKISRIGAVTLLADNWANEQKHQKSKTDCFRISSFEQTPVKLELSLMAKNLLIEEYPMAEQDLRKEDGKWVLETMVSGMEGVGRFVMGLATEVKIIDSPELENYIREFIEKHLKGYLN